MSNTSVPIANRFYETTSDVFKMLTGYTVGDVEIDDDVVITRYDKKIENVIISRRVMFNDDGISITDDYVLDILLKEQAASLEGGDNPRNT
jgi:hypothetical protein